MVRGEVKIHGWKLRGVDRKRGIGLWGEQVDDKHAKFRGFERVCDKGR